MPRRLPFPDRSFDGYTIAFGLRNVTDIDKALREAHRVLKPGGRFYLPGIQQGDVGAARPRLRRLFRARAAVLRPRDRRAMRESYRYLHESIRRFPPQRELADAHEARGLRATSPGAT